MTYCAKVTKTLNAADMSMDRLQALLDNKEMKLPSYTLLHRLLEQLDSSREAQAEFNQLAQIENNEGQHKKRLNELVVQLDRNLKGASSNKRARLAKIEQEQLQKLVDLRNSGAGSARVQLETMLDTRRRPVLKGLLVLYVVGSAIFAAIMGIGTYVLFLAAIAPLTLLGLALLLDERLRAASTVITAEATDAEALAQDEEAKEVARRKSLHGQEIGDVQRARDDHVARLRTEIAARRVRLSTQTNAAAERLAFWNTAFAASMAKPDTPIKRRRMKLGEITLRIS